MLRQLRIQLRQPVERDGCAVLTLAEGTIEEGSGLDLFHISVRASAQSGHRSSVLG